MSVVALIPARGGSTRVPRKNLRNCGGHPLVAWSIRAAVESRRLSGVYVSTEDREIETVSELYGAEVIRRPAALATNEIGTEPVIEHALCVLDQHEIPWDACLLLQPTSPLRWTDRVDQSCEMLETHDTVVSVSRDPLSYFVGTVEGGRFEPRYTERPNTQDIPLYRENGAIFGFTRQHWERHHTRIGHSPGAIVLEQHEDLDVDTEHDLTVADDRCLRWQLRRHWRIPWPLPEKAAEEKPITACGVPWVFGRMGE